MSDDSTSSIGSARASEEIARERRADEVAEACHPDTSRTKPSVLAQSVAVDEVDSAALVARSDQDTAVKYEQARTPDLTSVPRHTNIEADESSRMPEYMNLAINMGHDSVKVLGAIPKKLPAPPVPPRGTTSSVE